MANGNLNSLYKAVSNQFDIGTFEDFSAKMQTPEDRKSFFDVVSMQFDIGDYEEYESKLGDTKKTEIEPESAGVSSELQKENKLKYNISNDKNGILDFLVSDVWFGQEDDVTSFLNSKYEGQDVRFSYANNDGKDEIEVLIGKQVKGEGEKFSLAFSQEENSRIFNNIKNHIDNYVKPTDRIENTEEWQDIESQLRETFDENVGDYYSEEAIEKEYKKILEGFVDQDGKKWEVNRAGAGNYIKLTSPGGVESKPFYVGGKFGMHGYGKDENTDITKEKIIEFIKRNPTKDKGTVNQEEKFRQFLFQPEVKDKNTKEVTQEAGYFTPDKIKEITGKKAIPNPDFDPSKPESEDNPRNISFLRGVESKGDFITKVREDMGMSGRFWFDEKGNDTRNEFDLLSNDRIEDIIGEVFNGLQSQEQTSFLNGLATKSLDDIEKDIDKQGYSEFEGEKFNNIDQFHKLYRDNIIKIFTNEEDRMLATANMELKYNKANLSDEEITDYEAIQENYTSEGNVQFINPETNQRMLVPRDKIAMWEKSGWINNDKNIQKEKKELEAKINNSPTAFDVLEDAVQSNSLSLLRANKDLNVVQQYTVSGELAESLIDRGIATLNTDFSKDIWEREKIDGEEVNKYYKDEVVINIAKKHMDHTRGMGTWDLSSSWNNSVQVVNVTGEGKYDIIKNHDDWKFDANMSYADYSELQDREEAYKQMYFLNKDLTSIGDKKKGYLGGSTTLWGNALAMATGSVMGPENFKKIYGHTKMDQIDNVADKYNHLGMELTAEHEDYIDRSLGQTITEGTTGSLGILLEFAVANKVTAVARGAKLLSKGRSLDDVLNVWKGTRYTNGRMVMNANQIKKMAKVKKMTVPEYSAFWGFNAVKNPGIKNAIARYVVEPTIEGLKFGSIGGDFRTGFGFGLAGQVLAPIMGTVTQASIKKRFGKGAPSWLINNSPKINKAYQMGIIGPTSFVAGSELGEVVHSISEDLLMNNGAWNDYIERDWGEYSDPAKRLLSNYAIGVGFGFTHHIFPKKINGKYEFFSDFRSLSQLKEAKREAFGKMHEWSDNITVKSPAGKISQISPELYYRQGLGNKGYKITKTTGWNLREGMTREKILHHQEAMSIFDNMYNQARGKMELLDPVLGQAKLKRQYKDQFKHYEKEGVRTVVEWGSNKTMGENTNAYHEQIYTKDGKKTDNLKSANGGYIRVKFNVDRINLGLAPHEMGHAGMEHLFGRNAMFKAPFIKDLYKIAKKIPSNQVNEKGGFDSLHTLLINKKAQWDLQNNPWDAAKINHWELFSYVAEHLAKPENLAKLREANVFRDLANFVQKTVGKELNQKYDFRQEKDIVRFFGDYIATIEKGTSSLKVLKHLENVIDYEGMEHRKNLQEAWEKEGFVFGKEGARRATTLKSQELVNQNMELFSKHYDRETREWKDAEAKKQYQRNVEEIKSQKKLVEKPVMTNGKLGYKEGRSNEDIATENTRLVETALKLMEQSKVSRLKDLPDGPIKDAIITNLLNNNIGVVNKLAGKAEQTALKDKNVPKEQVPSNKSLVQEYTLEALKLINNYNPKVNPEFGAYLQSKKTGLPIKYGTVLKSLLKGQVKGKTDTGKIDTETEGVYQPDFEIGKGDRVMVEDGIRLIDEFFKTTEIDAKTGEAVIDTKKRNEIEREIESAIEKLTDQQLSEIDFVNVREFHKMFGGEKPHAIYTALSKKLSDMITGKTYKKKVEFLEKMWDSYYKAGADQNVIVMSGIKTEKGKKGGEGRSIELRNRILDMDYTKGKRTTDDATGASTAIWEKKKLSIDEAGKKEWLRRRHIETIEVKEPKPDGTMGVGLRYQLKKGITENEKLDIASTIQEGNRSLVDQVLTDWMRKNYESRPELMTMMTQGQIIAKYTAGRSRKLLSEKLVSEEFGFENAEIFTKEIQSERFGILLNHYRKELRKGIKITDVEGIQKANKDAVVKAVREHFDFVANPKFTGSKADLKTIAEQLAKEFKYAPNIRQEMLAYKVFKAREFGTNLDAIDAKAGIPKYTKTDPKTGKTVKTNIWKSYENLIKTQNASKKLVKELIKEFGVGVEGVLLRGESGGAGFGYSESMQKAKEGIFGKFNKKGKWKSQNRHAIWETAEQFRDMVRRAEIEVLQEGLTKNQKFELKRFEELTVAQSDIPGNKGRIFKDSGATGKTWDTTKNKQNHDYAEVNKKILLRASEMMRKLYETGEIDNVQARIWTEMHFGEMGGLGKKSASLALVPNMSPVEMRKLWGNKPEDYVLEHTTPANYVKARLYDYIINGGTNKKKALELTLKDYHTTLIPESLDLMVNKVLKTELPSDHLPGMDPMIRYYDAFHSADFNFGLRNINHGKNNLKEVYDHHPNLSVKERQKRKQEIGRQYKKALSDLGFGNFSKGRSNSENLESLRNMDKALELARKRNRKARGMSTFDFDETVGVSDNFVIARKGKETKRIASHEWPLVGDKMVKEGWKMDFSDFNKVTKGRPGPLMQKMKNQIKKYGPENVFILTARAPESAKAIHDYLKSEGVEIPFKNITGLGNSTGEAKAMWMLEKFAEGYNDMYFVDDALPNVKAVKDVLNQLDIKSNVQIARQLKSENLGVDINNIMEHSLDIGSKKVFSKAEAKVRGKDIKRRRVFMRDSAADLELLIEPLYGKGKKGIENKKWFREEFVMPFERGIRDYNTARQSAKNDYINLRKQNKDVVKQISKEVEGTTFTNDMAMRVYLWNKAGYKIPDLAKATEAKLVQHIINNPKLQAYAENFAKITKQKKGLKEPGQNWWGETMAGEVTSVDRGVSRKQHLQEWIDIKNEIFTEANLNKMESKLGTRWRENIEDMFDRMETGRTRSLKLDRGSAAMMNYLNGGIGTIMNFNTRSAMLQTISTTNFLNMRENNPIAAARAMGNVKQFSKDFMRIMNSDMLKQRRDGLSINVTEAEIASAAASSTNMIQSVISKVLKAGYIPTKLADSFAISFGGATFYRNRIKMYEKQGIKTKEAEKKAWLDFQVLAERTQQSSRADLLSKQQTSLIGRFILPFANTPMQMNRAGMKDILDISKGRYKDGRELTEKVGRISYYMGAQVAIFAGLQSALFAMLLNDDDVSDEKLANTKSMMLNTTTDSMLRGFGIQGALMSAFKNATQEYFKQSAKGYNADYSEVAEDLLNLSPPIGSKFGMLDRAGDTKKWAKINKNDKFKFELGNPSLEASLMTVQAVTNAPVYSPYQNMFNLKHAMSDRYENWQRFLMGTGWTPYSVGIETEKKKKNKNKSKKSKGFKTFKFK